jgi:hypothetical protein
VAKQTIQTPEKDELFFASLSSGRKVMAACADAGYKRPTVYQWREADEAFAARWKDAIEDAVERMEAEADRRAVEGTRRPVFYKGDVCGHIREFSDTLLIFRLKALRPDVYRERHEHTGAGGKDLIPPETDLSKVALALLTIVRGAAGDADGAKLAPDAPE